MAGILSQELSGISGSLAHPMRQISGSVSEAGFQPVTTGGGFTAIFQANGWRVTLDNGPTNEVLAIHACWSGATAQQGTTIRVANDSLTAPGGFVDFALGTAGADILRGSTDRVDFTLLISGPFA